MIREATEKDWDDFWKSEDISFKEIWEEMESIEPLTPVKQTKRES